MNGESIDIVVADSPGRIEAVRELFREYVAWLGIDLCFQNFEHEFATLPGRYAPPTGCLLLARSNYQSAGCAALRDIGDGRCEMKRFYVRPAFRGAGLGRRMAAQLIETGRRSGYRAIRLDTLSMMVAANRLYESLGFVDIPPYDDHAIPGTRWMELSLAGR